jgi:NAD+ kinase
MRVLVVYKRSFLEAHPSERRAIGRLSAGRRARLREADRENRRALEALTSRLSKLGVAYDALCRGGVAARHRYGLVVALGGDGTVFAAARHVGSVPVMGINSDPENSLGLWTCADRHSFERMLEPAIEGRLARTVLSRLEVVVNGQVVSSRVFNDVLYAHRNPAAMTRYRIEVGRREEEQKSSGVWISTAAGSTAAIRSAGGRRMPIGSALLQYLVREPFTWPRGEYRLTGGLIPSIAITTFLVESSLWLDGTLVRHDLGLGDRVELRRGEPLVLLGYDESRRRRLFP